jgi:uncharacterized protein (DUF1810 family)
MSHSLSRFIDGQRSVYAQALMEIRAGRKQSHWMWFIFPQLAGLGHSEMARYYGIRDLQEATAYLQHPVLGARLKEISAALLLIHDKTAIEIFGTPDDLKLRSCMTLFAQVPGAPFIFEQVLARYYRQQPDSATMLLLG